MNSLDDLDPNLKTFLRPKAQHNDLSFPKHYLLLEVERLEVSIKHFYVAGTISKDDCEYLSITLKMIKTFLNIRLNKSKQTLSETTSQKQIIKERPPNKYKVFHKHSHSHSHVIQPSLFEVSKPFPIEVSGLTEGLKELKQKSPENIGPKFPYKIPAGTEWEHVTIKFLNDEEVEISVKRLKYRTDYKEMGMKKGKIPEPSEQWVFLKVLAKYRGELTIKDPDAKDKYKKQKQILSEILRNYFSIDYDPFHPYYSTPEKPGNSYKIKLFLIPPPEQKIVPILEPENDDTLGIHEFLTEEAPQIPD